MNNGLNLAEFSQAFLVRIHSFPLPLLMLRILVADNIHPVLPSDRLAAFTETLD